MEICKIIDMLVNFWKVSQYRNTLLRVNRNVQNNLQNYNSFQQVQMAVIAWYMNSDTP